MAKKMLIDATHAEETRVVVVDGKRVEEFDFESENKRQLAGNIYLAKVSRVEPSLQAAFVEYGGNRHGFLPFSEIHPDYYQIPIADREALLAEERAFAEAEAAEEDKPRRSRRSRSKPATEAEAVKSEDVVETKEVANEEIAGMAVVDLGEDEDERPYVAADDAAERDESIESVADEDVREEIRPVRKTRPRRYKIQEVIKVRQILLVQVTKEERGNKGAALNTYLSLAGRYCVLMPNTARGGGISRKITNAPDRKKLKDIAGEIDVPDGAGLIIRTAGAKRTKAEIKRDYDYLQRVWEQIRELTLKSIAPAKIYEEGDLIKRSIRDLYDRNIDEVHVEGEEGYNMAKDFMKMIMPSHAKNVKLYDEAMPLFARYQVESYLASMFNPTVKLKSGGYIVIGVTEALVAIDVNSGRATKKGSIEETALETNLEAAEEIARQLRLRDLAGLIVIDFIDMEERKNNSAVEKRFKERLKTDRARVQVGRISGFGLLEMSRQRLRPGMIEATTQPCPACHGTGLLRSDDSLALAILRQLEEEGVRRKAREVLVKAPVGICNYLVNYKREHIAQIEGRYGMSVRIEADAIMIPPEFIIEKLRTAKRVVRPPEPVVSVDVSLMPEIEEEKVAEAVAEVPDVAAPETDADEGEAQKKKRRRRRRRRGGSADMASEPAQDAVAGQTADDAAELPGEAEEADEKPKRRRRRSRPKKPEVDVPPEGEAEESVSEKPKTRSRARKAKAEDQTEAASAIVEASEPQELELESAEGTGMQVDPSSTAESEPFTASADSERPSAVAGGRQAAKVTSVSAFIREFASACPYLLNLGCRSYLWRCWSGVFA